MRIFLSRDPGGANAVAPLYRRSPGPKELWGKDYSRAHFARQGLGCRDFNAEIADRPLGPADGALVAAWVEGLSGARLLVTSTGNLDDFTDRLAWEAAAAAGIPTVAVVDQWVRPLERFQAGGKTYRPDYALVPSREMADRLMAEGCVRREAVVLGHPHLLDLSERIPELSARRGEARDRLAGLAGRPFRTVVTFASEPFRFLASQGALFRDVAFDELHLLRLVKEALASAALPEALLVVKLHPKDDPASFAGLRDLVLQDEMAPHDLLAASDLVVGLKGMLLIEAVLLGKAVYGLTLHPSPDERLVTHALGLSFPAGDAVELADRFRNFPNFQASPTANIARRLGLGPDGFAGHLSMLARAESEMAS